MKIKKLLSVNGRVDMPLLISVILLSAFGTVMVFSAGGAYAAARYDDSAYFVKKQIDEGRQAYIVCPLVEENEEMEK